VHRENIYIQVGDTDAVV